MRRLLSLLLLVEYCTFATGLTASDGDVDEVKRFLRKKTKGEKKKKDEDKAEKGGKGKGKGGGGGGGGDRDGVDDGPFADQLVNVTVDEDVGRETSNAPWLEYYECHSLDEFIAVDEKLSPTYNGVDPYVNECYEPCGEDGDLACRYFRFGFFCDDHGLFPHLRAICYEGEPIVG